MKDKILQSVQDGIRAVSQLSEPNALEFIDQSSRMIADCFRRKNKLLVAGNGGSLCDALHCAEELTGQFRKPRAALPAIALADAGHMSCVSNDLGFDKVFSRYLEALGQSGDVFIGLSTSGNSPNLVEAFEAAKKLGLKTIAFLGKNGGKLRGVADLELIISGFSTSDRIQEAHMTAIHIMIERIEDLLFYHPEEELVATTSGPSWAIG